MATTLEKFTELQKQLASLKGDAIKELQARAADLEKELEGVRAQLANLVGEEQAAPAKRRGPKPGKRAGRPAKAKKGSHKEFSDAAELKGVLTKAGGKLNRKGFTDAGYSLKSAKAIAKTEPKTFGIQESGAQGSVWIK